jgi:hypothetical protein
MGNKLQGWLAPNTLTEDPNDRILVLNSAGTVDNEQLYKDMREEDTGLRKETIVHVVTLYERMAARALMNGHNLNTGLFYAVPRFTGLIEDGQWNSQKNKIYVSFTQNRVLSEEIKNTKIEILGEKGDPCYISGVLDCSNNVKDGHITPGRNFRITGSRIRIEGTDEKVGITFRSLQDDKEVKVATDMFGTNKPSELIFIAPAELTDGEYEMTLTTQFSGNNQRSLKTTRSISRLVYVGAVKGDDDDDDRPVIE